MHPVPKNKSGIMIALMAAVLLLTAGAAMAQAKLRWTGCGITPWPS